MKHSLLQLLTILLFGYLPTEAQSLRDLSPQNVQDTVIKATKETYRLEKANNMYRLQNMSNKLDSIGKHNNPEKYGIKPSREHLKLLENTLSPNRLNEFKNLKTFFVIEGVCDSLGQVKECYFTFSKKGLYLKIEEIEALEKAMKNYKVIFTKKIPGVEYYNVMFPFGFKHTNTIQNKKGNL